MNTPEEIISIEGPESGKLILFAEDDVIIKKLTTHILVNSGFRVIQASDGEEALQIFNKYSDQIDLLILDGIMPEMSGTEVYRNISLNHKPPPVVFCSGYSDGIKNKIDINNKDIFLILKPYKIKDFKEQITSIIGS